MTPEAKAKMEARKARAVEQEKKHAAWRKCTQKEKDDFIAQKLEASAERHKEQVAARESGREVRAALRRRINSPMYQDVTYWHYRQHKVMQKVRTEDGKLKMGLATPSRGGICVAARPTAAGVQLGVAVCARGDVYD